MQMFHHLSEDDPDRRLEFCEWARNKLDGDANFTAGILFTDEANYYIVTVLGTICIQTYSCPEVSYAIKYMCR